MTLEAVSSLPFSAGGAVAAAAGRGALSVIGIYMRQPLRNTALAALIGLSAMAGANALYKQSHHHPAPLFGSFDTVATPAVSKPARAAKPVMPVDRPAKFAIDTTETTGSLAPVTATPSPVIGNDDVMAMQKKLAALNFFAGTADGLFGPRTAKAIKAFEQSVGRTQRGLLTQTIVDLIAAAPMPAELPPAQVTALKPAATVQPLATKVAAAPLLLPAPQPLMSASADAQATAPVKLVASLDPAGGAGGQTVAMTDPGIVPKRVVQTIAVRAETGQPIQPLPSELAPAQAGDDASTDPDTVASVQRGLNSLGFLHGEIDGVAGDATAKAIRNFEVYYNYDVTGRISKALVNLLVQNGAVI